MSPTYTQIRQSRMEAAFLFMHQEAARGMRLFVLDRHYKPFIPLALRRLRTHLGLPRARKPYLRLRALAATYEQIEAAYERRYNRIEKQGGDAEWFADKWQLGLYNVGKGIPYTAAFAQEFPNLVQAVELWRLTNWLQEQCTHWPLGTCDHYDYQYIVEVLQEPLLRSTAVQPHLLNKAIDWLREQIVQHSFVAIVPKANKPIDPPSLSATLESLFIEPTTAEQYVSIMVSLLVEWGIVSPEAPHHWCLGELKGKANYPKGAFPALYHALKDTKKVKPYPPNIWAPIFCERFGVTFTSRHARKPVEDGEKSSWFYEVAKKRFEAV